MSPVSLETQGAWFLWSVAFGAGIGLVYHVLRGLRRNFPPMTFLADLGFLWALSWAVAKDALVFCQGAFRFPQVAGLLTGSLMYWATGQKLLEPFFSKFWSGVRRFWDVFVGGLRKILKKTRKKRKIPLSFRTKIGYNIE